MLFQLVAVATRLHLSELFARNYNSFKSEEILGANPDLLQQGGEYARSVLRFRKSFIDWSLSIVLHSYHLFRKCCEALKSELSVKCYIHKLAILLSPIIVGAW
jgi:hypothetical protein